MKMSTPANDLNQRIVSAHNPGLVRPNEAPNGNIIYHLYSDGAITFQKGGDAYGQRSMYDMKTGDYRLGKIFDFPLKCHDGTTYAILTKEQCEGFREEMMVHRE